MKTRAVRRLATTDRAGTLPIGDPQFQCSGCSRIADVIRAEYDDRLVRRSVLRPAARAKLWRGEPCPPGGPSFCLYSVPEDPTNARYRVSMDVGGASVTLCTPAVVRRREGRYALKYLFGTQIPVYQIFLEWYIQEQRKTGAFAREVDLDLLPPVEKVLDAASIHLRKRDGVWHHGLVHRSKREVFRQKAERLSPYDEDERPTTHDLAKALGLVKLAHGWRRHFVQVPIDIREPIASQLARVRPQLQEVHEFLFRAAGQPRPRPGRRSEAAWRDIYIYLLRQERGLTAAQIAEEVFPRERRQEAAQKVRACISRVRAAWLRASQASS